MLKFLMAMFIILLVYRIVDMNATEMVFALFLLGAVMDYIIKAANKK